MRRLVPEVIQAFFERCEDIRNTDASDIREDGVIAPTRNHMKMRHDVSSRLRLGSNGQQAFPRINRDQWTETARLSSIRRLAKSEQRPKGSAMGSVTRKVVSTASWPFLAIDKGPSLHKDGPSVLLSAYVVR